MVKGEERYLGSATSRGTPCRRNLAYTNCNTIFVCLSVNRKHRRTFTERGLRSLRRLVDELHQIWRG